VFVANGWPAAVVAFGHSAAWFDGWCFAWKIAPTGKAPEKIGNLNWAVGPWQ